MKDVLGKSGCTIHKIQGCLNAIQLEFGYRPATDAPYLVDRIRGKCLGALVHRIDHAYTGIAGIAFGVVGGHLTERLGRCYADGDGDANAMHYL